MRNSTTLPPMPNVWLSPRQGDLREAGDFQIARFMSRSSRALCAQVPPSMHASVASFMRQRTHVQALAKALSSFRHIPWSPPPSARGGSWKKKHLRCSALSFSKKEKRKRCKVFTFLFTSRQKSAIILLMYIYYHERLILLCPK